MIASRGQNRVFPLARVGRVGFGPSAEPEPEGKLDGCTFAMTSKRIRHQPECTWNQTLTDSGAPVLEAGNSGDEPGGCRTCSGMAGRNVGGTKSDDPVSHPSNGDVQTNQSPPRSGGTAPGDNLVGRTLHGLRWSALSRIR